MCIELLQHRAADAPEKMGRGQDSPTAAMIFRRFSSVNSWILGAFQPVACVTLQFLYLQKLGACTAYSLISSYHDGFNPEFLRPFQSNSEDFFRIAGTVLSNKRFFFHSGSFLTID